MAAEFVIAGRTALPAGDEPWELELLNDEGGVIVYTPSSGDAAYTAHVARIVGFAPVSIVMVRKAWDCGQVVAELIAEAVDGAMFCDVDNAVLFDAHSDPRRSPVAYPSRGALEAKLRYAFRHPEPYFARWDQAVRASFHVQLQRDPKLASDNDWSEI